ncbi:hypothetical protein CVT24_009361 [Panaeolus cyanescens]|uniref:Cutinase n=1 Tax=Panaeolus cyanescens TaxID=181874 RepID=A0A409Y820_9AGAR|nr:hypothetical protein CVT24_009361 [Panaeolus cyanescens]
MFSLFRAVTFSLFAATALAAPAAEIDVEARQLTCPGVKVFFARGTTEVPTLGAVVGPQFASAVRLAVVGKTVDVEGLDYPALVSGYLAGGDIGGAIRMANDVTSIANRCPNTKIVMSGYSQGAQVTHRAAARLSSAIQQRVNAVVTFGDPYERTSLPGVLQSRRKTFCAFGDLICSGQPIILPAHLGYGADAPAAAAFIAARIQATILPQIRMRLDFFKTLALATFAATAFAAPAADVEARQLLCPDVKVFFARGTTEIPTLGTVVGPPFAAALNIALVGKNVDFEGLDYPALVSGYLAGGDIGGAIKMANDVTSIASRCANTKIVMSGYSQGAQVTHRAAARLSSSVQQRVDAVVTFGDPYEDTALPGVLQSRRKTFCAFGDLICTGQPIILPAHLGYGADAPAAAAFVAARV